MKKETIELLKDKMISTYRKKGEKNGLVMKGKKYSGFEIANEIENETELGIKLIDNILNLTIDLLSREKLTYNE